MKQLKAVLFDLDGTLTDTLQDITNAVNHALKEHRMPTRTPSEVRKMVGNGLFRLASRAARQGATEEELTAVYQTLVGYYRRHATDCTKPYPGVCRMLNALKARGIRLAVLSNKLDADAKEIVQTFFPGVFSVVFGQREGVPIKPHPAAVQEILSSLGVTAEEAAYVGDSEVDVETAKNAGLVPYAVTWGFRDAEELIEAGATALTADAEELLAALCLQE